MLALAVHDAIELAGAADVAAALTLEGIRGCARAFDPKVHRARGLRGQQDAAANIRALVATSKLVDGTGDVQDPYSVRCAPAVHGASRDAVAYARMVIEREINAATDNPLFFPGAGGESHADGPWDARFRDNWPDGYRGDERASYSAGNFHGEPVGLSADFLAIALAELANVSERRTQMLLDKDHNRDLPANLIARGGLNSGLMVTQYGAASLVSENKVLAHPSSVDSIPTAANIEDHVAMATNACRKVRRVLQNLRAVLAIELLVAAQAVEWRVARMTMRAFPAEAMPSRERLQALWEEGLRTAAEFRGFSTDRRDQIEANLSPGTRAAYRAVRAVAPTLCEDRPLDEDIRAVRSLLEDGSLVRRVTDVVRLRPPPALSAPADDGDLA